MPDFLTFTFDVVSTEKKKKERKKEILDSNFLCNYIWMNETWLETWQLGFLWEKEKKKHSFKKFDIKKYQT